jgi:hypothetical protein
MTEKEKLIGEMNSLVEWLPDSADLIEQCWDKIKILLERSDNNDYVVSSGKPDYTQIALEVNKIIHDACPDVPHDIGFVVTEHIKGNFP